MNQVDRPRRVNRTTRREFLTQSLVAAGAAATAPWVVPASALGKGGAIAPSERIVLGAIGIGGRGGSVLQAMLGEKDVHFVAVCDVQASRRKAVQDMAARTGHGEIATFRDFRELLARADIDAVLIATGDRWHTVASIMAMNAGKDVYSEKPCGLDIGQVQALADAVARTGRVFQAGTQRRSVPNFDRAVQLAQSGRLGRIHTMHASIYRPSVRFDWLPEEPLPPRDELDWDLWLGPAGCRPYNRQYITGRGWQGHDDFTAGAVLLDWGAHTVDICQWANRADDTVPLTYEPTKEEIVAYYANGVKLVMDYLDTPFSNVEPKYRNSSGTCPVRFDGSEGWVETGDQGTISVSPKSLESRMRPHRVMAGTNPSTHTRNFLDCVKTRALPAAHAGVMLHSHVACFAAATAWRLERKLTIDPSTSCYVGDDEANRTRHRALREPWRT
jgi:predicted dehydrogenase